MDFVVCGLNYKTAPLNIRENVAIPPDDQYAALQNLLAQPHIKEAAILSTCNRTEFYCVTAEHNDLVSWVAHYKKILADDVRPCFYLHKGHHGIHHILRVASGLDSMMIGEPQIFGQMKQIYQFAKQQGGIGTNLRTIFEYVFSASKRVRHRSGIGNNPVSIAYAALTMIQQFFADISPLKVLVIGSGEMAALIAKYLYKEGVQQFYIASRTKENAQQLAASFGGLALTIQDIPQYLAKADIVISATACPLPFINKAMVEHALKERNNAPMFFIDLAVPRDIEPDVAELPLVRLCNIDDLQEKTEKGLTERRAAALLAEQMIENELDNFIRWHRSLNAKEIICNYRNHMQTLAQKELDWALGKLAAQGEPEQIMQQFCDRLVNKLLHYPTTGIKQAAWDDRQDLLELANYLYNSVFTNSYEEITRN